jgi:hypothetical protein
MLAWDLFNDDGSFREDSLVLLDTDEGAPKARGRV